MRKSGIAIAVALSVTLGACVQTRQYADLQFAPPEGDYDLLVPANVEAHVNTVHGASRDRLLAEAADWRASLLAKKG